MGKRRGSSSSVERKEKKSKKNKRPKLSKYEKLVDKLLDMKRGGKGEAPNGVVLTKDDYYTRQAEFVMWLAGRKKRLDDFDSTEAAMEAFCKFALAWNTNRLPEKFYTGLTATSLSSSCRTSYKWGFVKKLDNETKMELDTARDSTDTNTFGKSWTAVTAKPVKPGAKSDGCSSCRGPWPCRNLECSKGRPATGGGGSGRDSNTCGACNGPWPCRNGNCPRGRPGREPRKERSERTAPPRVSGEPERFSRKEMEGLDTDSSMQRAMGEARVSMFDD